MHEIPIISSSPGFLVDTSENYYFINHQYLTTEIKLLLLLDPQQELLL